jgi:hypothetical protein
MPLDYRTASLGEQALRTPRIVLYADLAEARRVYCMTETESTEAVATGLTVGRRDMGMGETIFLVEFARLLDILCKRGPRLGRPPRRFGP